MSGKRASYKWALRLACSVNKTGLTVAKSNIKSPQRPVAGSFAEEL